MKGQSLTHQIANSLGAAIVTGVHSADNPIPIEADLCRQFNASRSILREAGRAQGRGQHRSVKRRAYSGSGE